MLCYFQSSVHFQRDKDISNLLFVLLSQSGCLFHYSFIFLCHRVPFGCFEEFHKFKVFARVYVNFVVFLDEY